MQHERTFAPFLYWQFIDQKIVLHARPESDRVCNAVADCRLMCESCRAECLATLDGMSRGDVSVNGGSLKALMDCAELCGMTASGLQRSSSASGYVAEACALMAVRCGESLSCEPDSTGLTACIASCRECAAACRAVTARFLRRR